MNTRKLMIILLVVLLLSLQSSAESEVKYWDVPYYDTLITSCSKLAIAHNGRMGHYGSGMVNMDFVGTGLDCDSTADVYMYSGSPFVLRLDGVDTIGFWSLFQNNSFTQIESGSSGEGPDYNWISDGMFVTSDSSLALKVTYYAVEGICNAIVHKLDVWSYDGVAQEDVRLGLAIDWDIPSDTGARNIAGFDISNQLVYQSGAEYHDDGLTSCQDNDNRFGAAGFVQSYKGYRRYPCNILSDIHHSAYIGRNDSLIFPNGDFVASELWNILETPQINIEQAVTDLHSLICYESNLTLVPDTIYSFYSILVTVMNGTVSDVISTYDSMRDWLGWTFFIYPANCCMCGRGNVDSDVNDSVDVADLVYFIAFSFAHGPAPVCDTEADVNGDNDLNISDIVYLVDYMFTNGPPPLECR